MCPKRVREMWSNLLFPQFVSKKSDCVGTAIRHSVSNTRLSINNVEGSFYVDLFDNYTSKYWSTF